MLKFFAHNLSVLLLLITFTVNAQKSIEQQSIHPIDRLSFKQVFNPKVNVSISLNEQLRALSGLRSSSFNFVLMTSNVSSLAKHSHYSVLYKDVPVFRSEIALAKDEDGKILVYSAGTVYQDLLIQAQELFPDDELIKLKYLSKYRNAKIISSKTWFWTGEEYRAAVRILIFEPETYRNTELIVDNTGDLLYSHDLNTYHHSSTADTLCSGFVFRPDPVTSASTIYGAAYVDAKDSDMVSLSNQLALVQFKVYKKPDTLRLENDYVKIVDVQGLSTGKPYSLNTNFNYSRSDDNFEAVNAFYHINQAHKHLQDLGFTSVLNQQIYVDVHAYADDNSIFVGSPSPPTLLFGDGGVDDAEDADVIIHEHAHAISYSIAPESNFGFERCAVDEGFGDYSAASYSYAISPFNWDKIFNWDGHNEFWNGREAAVSSHYPEDIAVSNIHITGQIWSSVLMQIHGDIGRDSLDKVLLQSMYFYAPNMTLPEAAKLLLYCDSVQYGQRHYKKMHKRLYDRGLIGNIGIAETSNKTALLKLSNTQAFKEATGSLMLELDTKLLNAEIDILDGHGRILKSFVATERHYVFKPSDFTEGMYILKLRNPSHQYTYKFLR